MAALTQITLARSIISRSAQHFYLHICTFAPGYFGLIWPEVTYILINEDALSMLITAISITVCLGLVLAAHCAGLAGVVTLNQPRLLHFAVAHSLFDFGSSWPEVETDCEG